ncbi:MAG: anaerobic nitric oxide reductase flavorubredoxin [Bacilli bacterium]|jgi:flavorubredoxin|nr:anaerobic nitric oxide reductase flavorubredoxin [Bacilli bacterium]MDD4057034.1 anaerobic nitric oxide reductase flavorubredoxin [Bacilli bacterium]MDY0209533.1 anaerobic nitric oxide reductase flavorubredoxin [Bacilli bacterium]
MKKLVKNNVYWVGKIDWELRKFHGDELSTQRGSTYNSYLIQEEKTVLIDTVWLPFAKEFVENLKTEVDLNSIDYIIVNHGEVDHSGALVELMKQIPNTPIYCTANAVKSLKGQYHQDWNFHIVKTGDSLHIGNGKDLVFVEMAMIHWPDSMATYMTKDNILFSNDAFGQHFANERLFDDLTDQCTLNYEALKYYANIVTPFNAIVKRKLQEIGKLNLPIDIIAPSHGVIWRKNIGMILEKYTQWCDDYQEHQATIIYDTMWNGTKLLAERIAEGLSKADPTLEIKVFNRAHTDENDLIVEVFKSKLIVLGSPTVGNDMIHKMAGFIDLMRGLKFKNKKAAAFGCYGWSGEAVKMMNDALTSAGFEIVSEGLRNLWNPTPEIEEQAIEFGKQLSSTIK